MKELTLPARTSEIPTATDFVDQILEELDCPMKAQVQIDVAIDEIFSNIANYAYDNCEGTATIMVEALDSNLGVILTFKDSGTPYNPLDREDPDVTLSAEDRDIGGLGIFLVKKTMDSVAYEYKDGCNILTICKNF